MTIRFSDNILNNIEGSGFIVRHRVPRGMQLLLMFLMAFDLIYLTTYLINNSHVSFLFSFILFISMASLCSAIIFFNHRFRNLILATEFQTAMLASATQLGTRFCCIVNSDGLLFYIDPGFQKTFPVFMSNGCKTLNDLFALTDIPGELRRKILDTLKIGGSEHMILSFKNPDNSDLTLVTAIDALPRPRGYFIIRGRDYVQKRAHDTSNDQDTDKTLIPLLEQTLNKIQDGVLVANNTGKILYVNSELEGWLGYSTGEILRQKLRASQVLYQYVRHNIGMFLLNDFAGDVILQRKDGSQVTVGIQQKLLTESGQKIGISALIDMNR